jgi:hypothetical protein
MLVIKAKKENATAINTLSAAKIIHPQTFYYLCCLFFRKKRANLRPQIKIVLR